MALKPQEEVLIIARAAEATFSSSEWTEAGYLTGTNDWIDGHPRLLRSLNWGDNDYKGHVIDAVAEMLKRDKENLKRLIDYAPIADWLKTREPGEYEELRAEAYGFSVAEVLPKGASKSALAALADAQALLQSRGPTSAIDRVHTGLHGYLESACRTADIEVAEDASANVLLKALLADHPALADLGARTEEVKRMLRGSASIIDAMGTVRNNASLAHPNEELLGHDEAVLVINLGRSLLGFLDAKLSPRELQQ